MIAFASPTSTYATGDYYSDGGTASGPWLPIGGTSVAYSSIGYYGEPAPTDDVFETPQERRRRLSLEAIARFRKLARHVRRRIVSVWQRPVTAARVCALSERWRVLV